jgi:hypothetical protein
MAVRGFRQSGEFKESKGFGPAGAGLRDEKQKERGRQAGKELKEALERGRVSPEGTEYTGKLAETMMRQNLNQFNQRQLRRRAMEDAPQRPGIMQGLRNFGQGIMSNLTPQRMLGSALGTALLGPLGGILGGLIGGTYGDDDPSNNFFGKIGSSLKKDFTDTVNFFTPQQVEQSMMTNMPVKRPVQLAPMLDSSFLESDLIDPSMRGDFSTLVNPDLDFGKMAPAGSRRPMFDATGGGFGLDSLMQPQQITINPGMGVNVVTDTQGNPITYGTSPDDIMQGGYIGYSGTGPISVDFDTMGQPLTQRQMETLRRN